MVRAETAAIRRAFLKKRKILSQGLKQAGVRFDVEPEGTFYCWGDISALPAPINDGMSFFRAALERQVICVPGEFFDVNPGQTPERAALAVPPLRALLVWPGGGGGR